MFNRLINDLNRSLIFTIKCSKAIQSNINLGHQMKILNSNKQYQRTLDLFDKYKDNPEELSSFAFTQALKACTQLSDIQRGSMIHHLVLPRIKNDSYILTSLIHLYMQCNDVTSAQSLFDKSRNKTLSTYGAIIKGYITNNLPQKAIDVFHEIQNPDQVIIILLFNGCAQLGNTEALNLVKKVSNEIPKSFHSNPKLLTSMVDALMKCGDINHAQSLFDISGKKSLSIYGAMMKGFIINNMPERAIDLFKDFKKKKVFIKRDDIESNIIIHLLAINASTQIAISSICQSIVEQIPNNLLVNHQIQNALIDMWGKVGCVDQAKRIFEKISQTDAIGYATMIHSYGLNGMGTQAIELFYQIPSQFIKESTYISVLNACSHSGFVDQARSIFKNIQIKTEKIYTTMIDCLSRASLFEEAQKLINEYELSNPPVSPMYMALLSGARNEKNNYLSEKIYHRMKKLFPESNNPLISASILLANVYASSGEIEKASDIRTQLNKLGFKKKVGLSRTAVNGKLFQFRAHDRSHPRSDEIYVEIDKISKELIEHGHQYDASWITRPLDKDETIESVLCGHSERLAIAWNFVANPDVSRIQVTNNLRICGDCHRATKLIAAIRQCEIIVRDANRIHHFYTNGQCSCNDYF